MSSRYFAFNGRDTVEERICRNLKYSLEQMKIAGEKDSYLKIIDSVIVGPELVRNVKILLLL